LDRLRLDLTVRWEALAAHAVSGAPTGDEVQPSTST